MYAGCRAATCSTGLEAHPFPSHPEEVGQSGFTEAETDERFDAAFESGRVFNNELLADAVQTILAGGVFSPLPHANDAFISLFFALERRAATTHITCYGGLLLDRLTCFGREFVTQWFRIQCDQAVDGIAQLARQAEEG